MQKSESIAELAAALAKAQAQFKAVGKDKTAKIASAKGSFSYAYADLATVIDATRPALTAQGLAVMQPVRREADQAIVTTLLTHSSGQWISEEMAWPVAASDNRSIGSGVTYARRHSYLAMVGGAATDEDDDAEQARGGAHETARPSSRAEAVKQKVAAQNGTHPDPISAFKQEALRESTALLGDETKAKAWLCAVREDPKAQRPWTDEDAAKVTAALSLLRAKHNQTKNGSADDEWNLNQEQM